MHSFFKFFSFLSLPLGRRFFSKSWIWVAFLLAGSPFSLLKAQEAENEPTYYREQFLWGLNFNTRGGLIGGINLRYSKAISERKYHTFSIDLVEIKHPREQRRASQLTGQFFIPGKQNYLYALRGQYGREIVLFKKARERGVQINGLATAGLSLGFLVPYYIEYLLLPPLVPFEQTVIEQFEPTKHPSFNLVRNGMGFAYGLGETKVLLGGSAKAALVFEYGSFDDNHVGFEAGMMLDAYQRRAVLMPYADNQALFPMLYITFFYGVSK
ncbi:hypothetical protein [Hugenholtzia roseola]|uniref:hypothetical protein n=1 Tax=Hugenholtzia roseola TaxID=1002 RepID=UPI0012B547B6|nr:hypothetical protein [Hugenholtzia roseola]